jgi:hypothetical protein
MTPIINAPAVLSHVRDALARHSARLAGPHHAEEIAQRVTAELMKELPGLLAALQGRDAGGAAA